MTASSRLIRAKYLIAVPGSAPIENGAVAVSGTRVIGVGRYQDLRRQRHSSCLDLGECVLIPGLINAHCHLNYTDLTAKLPPPQSFTGWVQEITRLKRVQSSEAFAEATRQGLEQLRKSGTTSVCDVISASGDSKSQQAESRRAILNLEASAPIRVWSALELIDVREPGSAKSVLDGARRLMSEHSRRRGGYALAPHSSYTASGALLRLSAKLAARRRIPLTIHIAESRHEFDMFHDARGPLFRWMNSLGADLSHCRGITPVQWLSELGVLSRRCIGVHMNYLSDADFPLVARSGMSVAHCPRSHAYFRHKAFPFEKLMSMGVNVCMGTDSAASLATATGDEKPSLDMFAEMRAFRRSFPEVAPEVILKLATINGAHALRREQLLGSIEVGKLADFVAVEADNWSLPEVSEAVVLSVPRLRFCKVNGRQIE